MCTAVTYQTKDHYFGRNLDLEVSYQEQVIVMPRNFPFYFRRVEIPEKRYAMIGMGAVADGYPLFYDATNEAGLSMAGLNFPGNADYKEEAEGRDNITSYEFIPWILSQCKNILEVRKLLARLNLIKVEFSRQYPLASLHWIIADKEHAITVESTKEGLEIFDNPVGILTNNPGFDVQMFHLNNYMTLSNRTPVNHFSEELDLKIYSRGMGAMGLPGDLSSMSRFVKAAFTKLNSVSGNSESESISQFFHILGSVEQQRGCVELRDGVYEMTLYSSCCNVDKGVYYYRTYENSQITAVEMYRENLDGNKLYRYPLVLGQQVRVVNQG